MGNPTVLQLLIVLVATAGCTSTSRLDCQSSILHVPEFEIRVPADKNRPAWQAAKILRSALVREIDRGGKVPQVRASEPLGSTGIVLVGIVTGFEEHLEPTRSSPDSEMRIGETQLHGIVLAYDIATGGVLGVEKIPWPRGKTWTTAPDLNLTWYMDAAETAYRIAQRFDLAHPKRPDLNELELPPPEEAG